KSGTSLSAFTQEDARSASYGGRTKPGSRGGILYDVVQMRQASAITSSTREPSKVRSTPEPAANPPTMDKCGVDRTRPIDLGSPMSAAVLSGDVETSHKLSANRRASR